MSELINGRTAEEIKAGLRFCTTGKVPGYGCNVCCPYLNTLNCWLPVKSDALALIERLEVKIPKWISVEERLPKLGEWVVFRFLVGGNPDAVLYATGCYQKNEYSSSGGYEWYTDDENYNCNLGRHEITHWMPLKEPEEDA